MAIWGEVEREGDRYVGEDDEWRVEIEPSAWAEACHVMTMRGIDRRRWMPLLHDVATWLTDGTLVRGRLRS